MAGDGGSGSREKRVGERIRADISEMIVRGAIRDPAVDGAIVSDVHVTKDLGVATVYLRLLSGETGTESRKKLVDAMKRAGGFLRRELGKSLAMRRVPELRFAWDDAADRAARLESIFDEIETERAAKEKGG
jgi:ribosome-binding factor A